MDIGKPQRIREVPEPVAPDHVPDVMPAPVEPQQPTEPVKVPA